MRITRLVDTFSGGGHNFPGAFQRFKTTGYDSTIAKTAFWYALLRKITQHQHSIAAR